MIRIREVLRLHHEQGLSMRQISASVGISRAAVHRLLQEAQGGAISWPLSPGMSDEQLAAQFKGGGAAQPDGSLVEPDWGDAHLELKKKGVTRQLLWEEYGCLHEERSYSYSQYCARYRQWCREHRLSMRQIHKAGEKCFVDYCGPTMEVFTGNRGSSRKAQIFVAVLGASNYTFAEATWSQTLADWLGSHTRMLNFFGGVPELIVPDNLRAGVTQACRYDPELNASYRQWADHYRTAVLPARPRKPKDKAKVEVGVQVVERRILARLRKHQFHSLSQLNRHIGALLVELNARDFQQLPGSRQSWFEQLDQPALRALPKQPYEHIHIQWARVNVDYHVQFDQHLYSVPYEYVGKRLQLHATGHVVRLYCGQHEVADHVRRKGYGMSTNQAHMPKRHQYQAQWSPEQIEERARLIGDEALEWMRKVVSSKDHPAQAFRVCMGLQGLTRKYPASRVNAACGIASQHGMLRLRDLRTILQNRTDLQPSLAEESQPLPQHHANVRGAKHFQ